MDRTEFARRREAALADASSMVGTEDIGIRVIEDDGEPLVVVRIANAAARPGVLQIVQRHFPGVPMRFES
jgi:hypothetical protein